MYWIDPYGLFSITDFSTWPLFPQPVEDVAIELGDLLFGNPPPLCDECGNCTDIKYGGLPGPSGKPLIHVIKHSTRKRAKDAARNEGKGGPMNHPSPKKGGPHYHPTDGKGKKIPGPHHEYPKK